MRELQEKLQILKNKLPLLRDCLDVSGKTRKIADLEKIGADKDFWNDREKAAKILKELELLRDEVGGLEKLENQLKELEELLSIAASEKDRDELEKQVSDLEKKINKLEFQALLGGSYDRNDVILSIHAGAGGVDAQDWAEMLLRMYLRWVEKNNFKAKILDESRGGEAGIKSATAEIEGPYAYGNLKSEAGVHRLVRLSPFNADNLRQTSFALVEVLPVIGEIKEVAISNKDLKIDTYRSSGAGGQSVNKTDSAVRITHFPTGIVVSMQNERSQTQNKEQAMKVLTAKLHQKYLEDQEKEKHKLRGEFKSAEWGNQIRSYVLHPYKLVKDHRTKYETANPEKVLDGELNEFTEAYLRFAAREHW
ncbi:MAG: peptide chain release factor 2 [Candidatus Moranbacteria bacterium]|nr:peptide chain release factor 2 [Candidatus Moranbacteria bacterium]